MPRSSAAIGIFYSGDKDLDESLKDDALRYGKQLIAKTFLVIYEERIVAFFSVMNDAIKLNQEETVQTKNLSRLHEYPALKIGRLAVDKTYQRKGFGKFAVDFVVGLAALINTSSACRFITVDSYHESILFYERNGFKRNALYEKKKDFVSMRWDILLP